MVSGSKEITVTSWDTLIFSWWENSQSIANNTTTIGWNLKLKATSSGRIGSTISKDWSVTVNGTNYSGTNTVNISNNATKTLASGTTTITHNDNGTKSFNYSFSQEFEITFSGSYIGKKSGSGSGTLTTIARASQPSCITWPQNTQNVGDIGSTFTVHMNRKSDKFTHYVYCKWHNKTVEIGKGVTDNVSWTIPMDFINDLPQATSSWGTIYVDTYNGSTKIGTKSVRFDASVPASVKPSCSISVSEGTSHGAYIKGLSTLKITITPTTVYGSDIASYSTSANGSNYTASSFTTGVLKTVGNNTITATVTDKRGRSGTASVTISVVDKSTLTVSNGTLDTAQTLTITRANNGFKHKIEYVCGSDTGYAVGSASTFTTDTSISWKPPLSLSSQNTKGTSVSITLKLQSYTSGGTLIGTDTKNITCSIPASVKPSCSISVSDAMGYANLYDGYIQGQSKLAITITPILAYGSAITSYSATANGARYSEASFTTGVITENGKQTITATVTDNRGRSGTATLEIDVLEYTKPLISLLKVKRCVSLEDGTEDMNGEFCQVTFSGEFSSLVGFNRATYIVEYKKTSESWDDSTTVELVDYTNSYLVTEGVYRFPAESGSSYNVRLWLKDI